jgi:hypothetical protein
MPQRKRRQRREEGGKGVGDAAGGLVIKRRLKAVRLRVALIVRLRRCASTLRTNE